VILNPDTGGTAIATTFTDSTHLSATIPSAFMANFGSTNSVGVQNPRQVGGTNFYIVDGNIADVCGRRSCANKTITL